MTVVIGDRLLLDVLTRRAAQAPARDFEADGIFTTSAWYYRLGRAALSGTGTGSLSGRLATFREDVRSNLLGDLRELPDDIGLLHPRVVVPVMFSLRVRRQLNMLSAEALAVAILVSGSVLVTTDSPLIKSGAQELGIEYDQLS